MRGGKMQRSSSARPAERTRMGQDSFDSDTHAISEQRIHPSRVAEQAPGRGVSRSSSVSTTAGRKGRGGLTRASSVPPSAPYHAWDPERMAREKAEAQREAYAAARAQLTESMRYCSRMRTVGYVSTAGKNFSNGTCPRCGREVTGSRQLCVTPAQPPGVARPGGKHRRNKSWGFMKKLGLISEGTVQP